MVITQKYVYDVKFLIVGRTGYKKIYFSQKLAINKFFGQLKKVE